MSFVQPAQFHIESSSATMAGMGGLETYDMDPEDLFRQPARQFAAQLSFPFRGVEMGMTM
jgi:hypothetical protein